MVLSVTLRMIRVISGVQWSGTRGGLRGLGSGAFSDLLKAVFCPVCGGELSIEEVEGVRRLKCVRHGYMNAYLDRDPWASEVARHCDALGVADLEAS